MKKVTLSPSVSIILAGALIALAIIFVNRFPAQKQDVGAPAPTAAQQLPSGAVRPITANEHIYGSPTAPVVMVEYSDFECPYCSRVYPTLKKLVDESNGQIAWVYRNLPLTTIHPEAAPAANAAECVAEQLGNAGYWKFADTLFANQQSLGAAYYKSVAVSLGADAAKFASCVAAKKYQKNIDTDAGEAQALGANGTPFTLIINTKKGTGVPVSGALPYAQFVAAIKSVQ